ncbi:hypothetical protein HPP92_009393 [Vanilla planifolia]|uniref:Pentatricopeptide repeat-containing protein n=1 Tax=Vanilla planifolia TaxID=51239 RepID=A0A835V7D3_VANPL|nr:hypothetical protein HPP92_009393 [Vanilla planifolia]
MAVVARFLPFTIKGFRRQIQTAVAVGDGLAARLLRERDSSIKAVLDSECSAPHHEGEGGYFWDSLVVRLGEFSPRKAQLILEWKLEKLLSEDVRTYDQYLRLILHSSKLNNLSFAMKVFTSIEGHGLSPNTQIFNALVSTSLSVGNFVTALSLFEIMQWSDNAKPDLATYNYFISMYSRQGDDRGMKGWYSAAKQSGFLPNIQTYELLIVGHVRSENFKDADMFYQELLRSKISPNSQILNAMLEGSCREKDAWRVRELIEYIMKEGWSLSKPLVEMVIQLHLEQGLAEDLIDFLDLLKPTTDSISQPSVYSSFIRFYAVLDKLDDMECLIGRMLNDGMMFTNKEDVEVVICSYFRKKAFEKLDLFLGRIQGSYKLARSTYDLLVAGYRKFGLNDRLDCIVKHMQGDQYASNM